MKKIKSKSDGLYQEKYRGDNDTPVDFDFATVDVYSKTITAGSEAGKIVVRTAVNGVLTDMFTIDGVNNEVDIPHLVSAAANITALVADAAGITVLGTNSLTTTLLADTIGITVSAYSGQTKDLQRWKDKDGNVAARVQANGRIYTTAGVKADAIDGGGSLMLWPEGGAVIYHDVSGAGSFDLTGGAYENLFTDTTNSPFTQSDADDHNWIIVRSGDHKGAMAEISEYIDADNVTLHTMAWDFDLADVDYYIMAHPAVVIGDGYHMEFTTGDGGHFDIHSTDWVGNEYTNNLFEVELDADIADVNAGLFQAEANGYGDVTALIAKYNSGEVGTNTIGRAITAKIDLTGESGADASTEAAAYVALVENGSTGTTTAFKAYPGFKNALQVQGASAVDPGYGYDIDASTGTVTDRVTGAPQAGTAFLDSSTSNVTIFADNADYILIGSDSTFEIIEWTGSVLSAKSVKPTFQYSTGNGTWSTLPVLADGTIGFQRPGQISYSAPGDWAVGNEAETAADITSAYYVKIARTRAAAITTLPVEDHFVLYASRDTGMKIDGNGFITPRVSADADAPNSSIYYSTDASKLVFKDSAGNVQDLY